MKALAARESDVDDLRILYRMIGFSSADEACSAVSEAYPHRSIKPMTMYLIEGIASEAGGAGIEEAR